MSQSQEIIQTFEHGMIEFSSKLIADDIADVFWMQEQFASPAEIGSALEDVEPLTDYTVALKRRIGSPFPEVPRVRSGQLIASISDEVGDLSGVVSSEDDEKAQYQQRTRAFFGVSARALTRIDAELITRGEKLIADLAPVDLGVVNITI